MDRIKEERGNREAVRFFVTAQVQSSGVHGSRLN